MKKYVKPQVCMYRNCMALATDTVWGDWRRVVVFREPMSWMKFASLSLIIAGVVGLNIAGR